MLYGSDRLGSINSNTRLFTNAYTESPEVTYAGWDISTKLTVAPAPTFAFGSRLLGTKEYDLSDHLGNVTVQLSDRKTGTLVTGDVQAEVLSYQQYFPFGWTILGRSINYDKSRFTFNGKELDPEWEIQDYGFRLYDNRVGRFLSFDPLAPEYPELTPYQFASNTPIWAIDLDGLEAFFIHGTSSSPTRWTEESMDVLMGLTNNVTPNRNFSWEDLSVMSNDEYDRQEAAERLVDFVIANRRDGEEITLIGHSHGGNVAIQAARMIKDRTGEKVNIITIATPTYDTWRENPSSGVNENAINDHIHLWNRIDGVQGGLAGDEIYENGKTINIEIDVSSEYGPRQWRAAHSFDVEHPELIEQQVDIILFEVNDVQENTSNESD